jgi:hypothetical protein
MDVTTASPVEIDTKLADLDYELAHGESRKASALIQIHRAVGDDTSYRKPKHRLTDAEAVAKAIEQAKGDDFLRAAQKGLDALAEAEATIAAVAAQIAPLEAEYDRRPWTRAWLVTSSEGHVHRSRHCSTCNIRTRYALMFMYSGKDEAEIVEAAGERACTVCYPTAPAEVLNRPTQMFTPDEVEKQAERAKRDEAKKAREAKKIANGLTPDGSEFVIAYAEGGWRKVADRADGTTEMVWDDEAATTRQHFKTERAASIWYVDAHTWYADRKVTASKQAAYDRIVQAMADKHDKTVAEIKAELDAKVAAKRKREGL